ncbi:unnamed protein product, partial [Amoebophrya sp. A25]
EHHLKLEDIGEDDEHDLVRSQEVLDRSLAREFGAHQGHQESYRTALHQEDENNERR